MAAHSFTRCWLHLIWSTRDQKKILTEEARKRLSAYFKKYAKNKGIYLRKDSVNPDHVHLLIDLPVNQTIEDVLHLLKGSSAHWVNQNDLIDKKFAWEKGYAAFSVSHSKMPDVENFIERQEEYHWEKTYQEEIAELLKKHELLTRKPPKTV